MLISKFKKFLFIHIQKTAGRSFEAVLKKNLPDLESFMGTHDHALWAKEKLGEQYSDYYKVAFVSTPLGQTSFLVHDDSGKRNSDLVQKDIRYEEV